MAKYVVIEPFTVSVFNSSTGKNIDKSFAVNDVFEAAVDSNDGKLKTTFQNSLPDFQKEGQTWLTIPTNKVKSVSSAQNTGNKNKTNWPLIIGGIAGIALLLYLTKKK